MAQVRIKHIKTDSFRKGVMVYLGRTGKTLCPVAAVMAYLAVSRVGGGGGGIQAPFTIFNGW